MFKLALLGLSIFSFTGVISSSKITKEIYDHRDEPSNTIVNYGVNADYVVPLTFQYQDGDYIELYNPTYNRVEYTLYVTYSFNSDYSVSRLTFTRCDLRYLQNSTNYYDISWNGNFVFNLDSYSLNDYKFSYSLNVNTIYNTQSFTCEFQLDCYLDSTNVYDNFYDTFRVGNEYDFRYYTESSSIQLNFNYFINYNQGYIDGRDYVLTHLSEFDLYTNSQYLTYGQIQYNLGVSQANTGFLNLFGAIADTPVIMIRNLFSFDLFGMSALTIFMSLLTGLIVIHFIRKVI